MKIKISILYGIIGGIFSLVLSFVLSSYFFIYSTNLISKYLIKKSPWPISAVLIELLVVLILFFSVFIFGIKKSLEYGKKEEHFFQGTPKEKWSLRILLAVAIGFLTLCMTTVYYQTKAQKIQFDAFQDFFSALLKNKRLDSVTTYVYPDHLEIKTFIKGQSKDKYQLQIDMTVGSEIAKGKIFSSSEPIELTNQKQEFSVDVQFDEISQKYKELSKINYVKEDLTSADIDENFFISSRLKNMSKKQKTESLDLIIPLRFICDENSCHLADAEKTDRNVKGE